MKASLKNYQQSPRKVRLIGDLIKGKSVAKAQAVLTFLPKRGALPIKKLLESAVANAKDVSVENLIVMNVTVNKGLVMKRSKPRARGSAFPINKRTSHVLITLKEKGVAPVKEAKKEVVAKKVAVKKAAVKKVAKKVTK